VAKKIEVKTVYKRSFKRQGYQQDINIKIGDKDWICGSVVVSPGMEYDPVTGLCENDENICYSMKGQIFLHRSNQLLLGRTSDI
jgi:hypothetical protein